MTSRKQGREATKKVIKVEKNQIAQKINDKKKQKIMLTISKINKKRFFTFIAITVVTCILLYFIQNYYKYGLVLKKNINNEDVSIIDLISSDYILKEYNSGIIVYERGKITAYNNKGNEQWDVELGETFTPHICVYDNYIQVINKDTGVVYVLDGQYETARIKIDGTLISGMITKNGVSVIEYTTAGTKTAIAIYDKKGNIKYDIKLDTNTVGTYAVSQDMRYFAYTSIDISGISLNTSVKIIDLREPANESLTQAILSENNELVYYMQWQSNSKLQFIMDKQVVAYDVNNDRATKYDTYDMNYSYIGMDKEGIAGVVDKGNDGLYFSFQNYGKGIKLYNKLANTPNFFYYSNGLSYITYSKCIEIYNKYGVCVKTYTSSNVITKPIVFNNNKSIAYSVGNKIVMFTI